jgi:hypothetical protein
MFRPLEQIDATGSEMVNLTPVCSDMVPK